MVLSVISVNAAAAMLSWKDSEFLMLWNIDLPFDNSIHLLRFSGNKLGVIRCKSNVSWKPALTHLRRHISCGFQEISLE